MSAKIKVGGSWKEFSSGKVKVGGAWKTLDKGYVKVGGSWKQFYVREIVTTTSITANTVTYPSDITVSGTVSPAPAGGTVTIRNGTTVLKTGVAVNTTTGAYSTTLDLDAGTYSSLNAVYSGFDIYLTSTSSNTTGTINKADTSTSINGVGTVNQGESVTVSGSTTLASVTITVQRSSDNSNWSDLTTTTSNGSGNWSITTSPPNGTYYYRAIYSASTNYNGSTSGSVSGYTRTLYYGSYSNGLAQEDRNWAQGSTTGRNQIATYFTMPSSPSGATNPVIYQLTIAFSGYGTSNTGGITPYLWNSAKAALAGGAFTTSNGQSTSATINSVACNLDDVTVSWGGGYWAGFVRSTNTAYYTQWATNFTTGYTTWEVGSSSNTEVAGKSIVFSVQYYYYA